MTIFVDSRTQRHYDSLRGPPQLVSEDGLALISKTATEANHKRGDPVIIVSASPVLGFYLIEALQKAAASLTSVYTLDLETWFANTNGRIRFLSFLMQTLAPRHCVYLSGDVHFSFTIKAAFARLQPGCQVDSIMSITQLNSSALKTTSLVKIAFVSEIMGRIRQIFPFKRLVRTGRFKVKGNIARSPQPDWIEARTIVKASGFLVPPLIISDNNLGLVIIEPDMSTIVHKLFVRKGTGKTRVHEAVVRTYQGRTPLEDLVRTRISEFIQK